MKPAKPSSLDDLDEANNLLQGLNDNDKINKLDTLDNALPDNINQPLPVPASALEPGIYDPSLSGSEIAPTMPMNKPSVPSTGYGPSFSF